MLDRLDQLVERLAALAQKRLKLGRRSTATHVELSGDQLIDRMTEKLFDAAIIGQCHLPDPSMTTRLTNSRRGCWTDRLGWMHRYFTAAHIAGKGNVGLIVLRVVP